MIPVIRQPEPSNFDQTVRQPGLDWLRSNKIARNGIPPDPAKLPDYWRRCLRDLWERYSGICAYLAIFFEYSTGAATTDHFIAKSKSAGDSYEWDNFRLSALGPNRNKNKFDDILDPFSLRQETFYLNTVSGKIYPNPNFNIGYQKLAQKTICRLKLNDPVTKEMRQRHCANYADGSWSLAYMEKASPFVWHEIIRQGLQNS